ncbi:hypothetical protein OXX80_011057 [Metschnikowia pulcherrima]
MKFVALISGGKDSFYNIMQCMKNGHELQALANLHPSDLNVDELDSFMFQTVGHDVIEYYRQCVDEDVPLYRRAITGGSTNVSLEYEITANDEIEDLYELLKEVKTSHPDVEGVSCGAILSHYQRTRVENVCERLGLTCLAYLWQSDQPQLMKEMCESGLEAILVKVAAIGLSEKHLGKSLSEMLPILTKLNAMYDVHVCGEGGEFETLVLDAPFFKRKLQVKNSNVINHSQDASYLSIEVNIVEKDGTSAQFLESGFPPLLQAGFESLKHTCEIPCESEKDVPFPKNSFTVRPYYSKCGSRLYVGNLTSGLKTVEEQTRAILLQLKQIIEKHNLSLQHIQHMTVLVQEMTDFSRLNSIYESVFQGFYLPPSRVCVETTLPVSCKLQISCVALQAENFKSGIHIRSRSYWAPQNIGPYSQAIVDTSDTLKVATLSGQIPLTPRSMVIDETMTHASQAILSLQHLHRVKSLISVGQIACVTCYITDQVSSKLVSEIWKSYVAEIEHGQDFSDRLLILQVKALPRQAIVEWGGLTYEKVIDMYADDSDEELEIAPTPRVQLMTSFKCTAISLGDSTIHKFTGDDLDALIDFLRSPLLEYTFVNVISDLGTIHKLSNMGFSAEWTPVLNVHDSEGVKKMYGVLWVV